MRWTRQRRARKRSQGGLRLVSDRPPRRRPALKRLRRNLGRQHMSRSKRFGGGSCGRLKACGSGTRGWCQADGDLPGPTGLRPVVNPSATEAKRIRLRGERAISRKPLRREGRVFRRTLRSPVCIFAHDRGCWRAPGFPCALFVFEGIADRIPSGASRRENAKVCLLVGWVERSETHRANPPHDLMGIASLHPSYGSSLR